MRRWLYLLIAGITVYLNIMYQWDLGIRILAAEICLLVFSAAGALYVRGRLDVQVDLPQDILEQKEEYSVKMTVSNSAVFGVPGRIVFSYWYTAGGKKKKTVRKLYVDKKKKSEQNIKIIPEHCGQIQIGIEKVYAYDFLGIWSFGKRYQSAVTAVVMPKPYPVNLCITNRTRWFPVDGESYDKDRSGDDASEIYDVREYQAGDRMQKVHWKISARQGELYIKEFSYPMGAAVVILLEKSRKSPEVIPEFLEAVLSLSFALRERDCAHYIAWKMKDADSISRVLIRKEEDLCEFIPEFMTFSGDCLSGQMQEEYCYQYRNDIYAAVIKIDTALYLRINEEETEMEIGRYGAEQFFQTIEIVI